MSETMPKLLYSSLFWKWRISCRLMKPHNSHHYVSVSKLCLIVHVILYHNITLHRNLPALVLRIHPMCSTEGADMVSGSGSMCRWISRLARSSTHSILLLPTSTPIHLWQSWPNVDRLQTLLSPLFLLRPKPHLI